MKTIEVKTERGILTHTVGDLQSIECSPSWAQDIMVAQSERITELEADYDQLSSDHQAMGVALRQAYKNVNSHTARCTDLENQLESEWLKNAMTFGQNPAVPAERVKCGLEAGDSVEVFANQAMRDGMVLATLFNDKLGRWEALVEYGMPAGTTVLVRFTANDDGTCHLNTVENHRNEYSGITYMRGTHHGKTVSYHKVPKKWLAAIASQQDTAQCASAPHSMVLCGQPQTGELFIFNPDTNTLDEVDPKTHFRDRVAGRRVHRADVDALLLERARYFYI